MNPAADYHKVLNRIAERCYESVPNINAGGCAIYALGLYDRLVAAGQTGMALRVYSFDARTDVSEVENNLRLNNCLSNESRIWNRNGVDFCHVRLAWDNIMWDCQDAVPMNGVRHLYCGYALKLNPGSISSDAMRLLNENPRNWNYCFDRDNIPTLHRIMDEEFQHA